MCVYNKVLSNAGREKVDSRSGKMMDVRELTGEHDGGLTPFNPDKRVTITIAGFADSLSISYKDINLHFDMSRIEDVNRLVKELVDSFELVMKGD